MMNLAQVFRRIGWIGMVFHRPSFFYRVLAEHRYIGKNGLSKKNKLIDIGLRAAFGGYWKLFMDG